MARVRVPNILAIGCIMMMCGTQSVLRCCGWLCCDGAGDAARLPACRRCLFAALPRFKSYAPELPINRASGRNRDGAWGPHNTTVISILRTCVGFFLAPRFVFFLFRRSQIIRSAERKILCLYLFLHSHESIFAAIVQY